ncbi:MAG: magnesium/cobalt transporter CorA [Chloroflexota bacterium]
MTSTAQSTHFTGYFRNAAGQSSPLPPDPDAIRTALAEPGGLVWIDLLVDNIDDTRLLSDIFQFHPLALEDVANDRLDPAKIDDHGDYIFVVVQALTGYKPDQEISVLEVDFFLGKNYVVSCHRKVCSALNGILLNPRRAELLMHKTSAWLLHGLLDGIVDDFLPIVDELDESIDQLENDVLERPDKTLLQRILVAKRNSLRLRRATTPQRDIMNRLSRGEFPALIPEDTAMYFRDIFDHLVRVEYLIEALRDLSDAALQTYLSVVSNRLNEVMRVLTAGATIFLPLTLISGIYGMNFQHNFWPPLESSWGFPAVTGTMILIAVVMLIYFRWQKWI